jgi:hypothetical protein
MLDIRRRDIAIALINWTNMSSPVDVEFRSLAYYDISPGLMMYTGEPGKIRVLLPSPYGGMPNDTYNFCDDIAVSIDRWASVKTAMESAERAVSCALIQDAGDAFELITEDVVTIRADCRIVEFWTGLAEVPFVHGCGVIIDAEAKHPRVCSNASEDGTILYIPTDHAALVKPFHVRADTMQILNDVIHKLLDRRDAHGVMLHTLPYMSIAQKREILDALLVDDKFTAAIPRLQQPLINLLRAKK